MAALSVGGQPHHLSPPASLARCCVAATHSPRCCTAAAAAAVLRGVAAHAPTENMSSRVTVAAASAAVRGGRWLVSRHRADKRGTKHARVEGAAAAARPTPGAYQSPCIQSRAQSGPTHSSRPAQQALNPNQLQFKGHPLMATHHTAPGVTSHIVTHTLAHLGSWLVCR